MQMAVECDDDKPRLVRRPVRLQGFGKRVVWAYQKGQAPQDTPAEVYADPVPRYGSGVHEYAGLTPFSEMRVTPSIDWGR